MPESLRTAYLRRLERELPLPDAERTSAIEEIEGHLDDTITGLTADGLPADVAERRALERLGAPERLAEALANAHRTPRDVLVAAGTGVRVTVVTALWSFITIGVVLFTVGVALAALYVLAQRFAPLPRFELDSDASTMILATTIAISGYAVGRAVLRPVAFAAHRRPTVVRPAVLIVGMALATWIGLAGLRQSWGLAGAVVMALLPAWFALGVMAPNLVPSWLPANRRLVGGAALGVIVVSIFGLSVAGPGTSTGTDAVPREIDPATEFAAIARFDHWEQMPLEAISDAAIFAGTDRGTGPLDWPMRWRLSGPNALRGWHDLHVEVWGSAGYSGSGAWIREDALGPLASAPLVMRGGSARASVTFEPIPAASFYHLAVVGTDPDGERQLAGWPAFRQWTWVGTPLEFLLAVAG